MKLSKLVQSKAVKIIGALLVLGAIAVPLVHSLGTNADAADCDNNAVIYCGAQTKADLINKLQNGDGQNSAQNIQGIYQTFGIDVTPAGINSAVMGSVTKSGDVIVNGQTVATNVWTAGRQYMQNSQALGSIWMRPPAVSFLSGSLQAYVNMDGGTFHWAVLVACGNPVKSINAPFGQIYKRVVDLTTDPNTNYAADTQATAVPVSASDALQYQITVTNNGTSPMTNVVITDQLPTGVHETNNPTKTYIGSSPTGGVNLGTIAAGSLTYYTVNVTVDQNVTAGTFIDNMACFTADQNQTGCDHAVIKVKTTPVCTPGTPGCATAQQVVCQGISATPNKLNSLIVTFTAQASKGVTGYHWVFGDGSSADTSANTVSHTFASAGNYNVTVQTRDAQGVLQSIVAACTHTFQVSACTTANGCQTTPPCTTTGGCTTPHLPQTGAEDGLASAMGLTGVGYSLRAYLRSKRSLLGSLRLK